MSHDARIHILPAGATSARRCTVSSRRYLSMSKYALPCLVLAAASAAAQTTSTNSSTLLLVPERVFDAPSGITRAGWAVLVRGDRIAAVGPAARINVPAGTRRVELANATLLPGLIEGHGHLLLHPYIEAPYADQVLREPLTLRPLSSGSWSSVVSRSARPSAPPKRATFAMAGAKGSTHYPRRSR